jgi:branched-chain amino acid transport system ATP-binding protein
MNTPALLEVRDLAAGYSGTPVLRNVSMCAGKGEIVALLGPNGAGKTTLLHTIAGVLPKISGSVLMNGQHLRGSLHRRARRGIGLITEERAIIRSLTAGQNLRVGRGSRTEALAIFPEISQWSRKRAGLLSGGEQQILALAGALSAKPKILLIDELSFGLAPLIVQRLLATLRAAADAGTTIVVVEQHPKLILAVADRGYVLARGQVQLEGSAQRLRGQVDEMLGIYLAAPPAAGAGK